VAGSDGYTYNVLQEDGAKPIAAHLGHDSQAVDDQAMEMDADADMDADVAADDAAAAAEGAGGVGDSSWQEPGSGNMRLQQEQAISQMMTGLSMGGGAGGRGGAGRGVNASVLGKDMHAGGWCLVLRLLLLHCLYLQPQPCNLHPARWCQPAQPGPLQRCCLYCGYHSVVPSCLHLFCCCMVVQTAIPPAGSLVSGLPNHDPPCVAVCIVALYQFHRCCCC
jgi:hypothetical protein